MSATVALARSVMQRSSSSSIIARRTAISTQQNIATFTYRAPKTIRANNNAQQSQQQHQPTALFVPFPSSYSASCRTYFWSKKVAVEPLTTGEKTTVTTVKEIPDSEPQQPAAESEPTPKTKSERLGFSGFSDAVNRLIASWPHLKTYSVWISVGVGILFVFKAGLNVIDFFATLNFLDVGEVAFIAGVLTGVGLVFCGWAGTRFLRLRPEPIFQNALKRINADSVVVQYLGPQVQSGQFRAYSFVNGSLRMTQEQREKAAAHTGLYKYWQPKRLQLFFQVTGSVDGTTGMVSAEVEKSWRGDFQYNLLSVDLPTGERIVLEGDPNYKIYKGVIKLR